ncbi:MAG: pentapeptide repeat-containing protein [Bacteroidales bacterium]|nr:pentapeptide repeat-containing protein [Bacteroidales bacterium]
MSEVDFNDCDLSKSKFINCDLSGAAFERTQLIQTDFRTAYNYTIDPEKNNIKKAVFSLSGVRGLLRKYDIKIE